MMNRIVFFIFVHGGMLHSQSFDWSIGSGTWVSDNPSKIVFDKFGNLYTTGHVGWSGATFGSFTSTEWAAFLVKQDPSGNVIWARFMPGSYDARGSDMVVDSNGNIYVVGSFSHHLIVEDTTLIGGGLGPLSSMFLIKYDQDGNKKWVKNLGINGQIGHGRMAIDKYDNIYLGGCYIYTLDLGNGVQLTGSYITYFPYSDIFISKFSSDGIALWGFSISSAGDDYLVGLKVGEDQDLHVVGQYNAKTVSIQNVNHDFPINSGSLILKCSLTGQISKVFPIGASVYDFSTDKDKGVTVAGPGHNPGDGNSSDVFVTKYDADLNEMFTRVFATKSFVNNPKLTSIGTDTYVAGDFYDSLSIDGFNTAEERGNFIVKLSDIGVAQWMKIIPSTGVYLNQINSMAIFQKQIAVTGVYSDTVLHLDGTTIVNNSGNGDYDVFIAVIDDNNISKCPPKNAQLIISNDKICSGDQSNLNSNQPQTQILTWIKDNSIFNIGHNTELNVNGMGEYYYIIFKNSICADTSNNVFLNVLQYPSKKLANMGNLPSCNEPVEIAASDGLKFTFQWLKDGVIIPNETNNNLIADKDGFYSCIVLNDSLCATESDALEVTILHEEKEFLPDSLIKCGLKPIKLTPRELHYNGWSLSWTTGSTNSSITVSDEGVYGLTLKKGNCQYSDSTVVMNFDELLFPNVITPNNDGKNDFYVIKNLKEPIDFSIFNRWGELIYHNKNYSNDWSGQNLEGGVYFYYAKDNSGCTGTIQNGWVKVIK